MTNSAPRAHSQIFDPSRIFQQPLFGTVKLQQVAVDGVLSLAHFIFAVPDLDLIHAGPARFSFLCCLGHPLLHDELVDVNFLLPVSFARQHASGTGQLTLLKKLPADIGG